MEWKQQNKDTMANQENWDRGPTCVTTREASIQCDHDPIGRTSSFSPTLFFFLFFLFLI